jgi:uncharacterized protein YqgV (UPF0045/DUF77 family)
VIVEVQCLPVPPGTAASRWAHVETAIAVIERSGLRYEVGPLGTSVEGSPDELWPLMRAVHEACLTAGAASVVTIIKAAQQAGSATLSIDDLVGKFRR